MKERKKERKKERMTLCVLTSLAAVLNEKGVREKPKGWRIDVYKSWLFR